MTAATITEPAERDHDDSGREGTDHPIPARRVRWSDLGVQLALIVVAGCLYFLVRRITEGAPHVAQENAQRLLDLERAMGLDVELGAQAAIISTKWIVNLANWVYIWLHWPVIIAAIVWLYVRHRADYRFFRNALFASGAIGLVIFALFPVMPPRLLPGDFVDTITELSHSYRVVQPPNLVNEFAAVPSFHVGWNFLVCVAVARVVRHQLTWVVAVLSVTAMTTAVVLTANHYVLDAVAGIVVSSLGLGVAVLMERHIYRRRAPTLQPAPAPPPALPGS
jgi:hypothetical protein